MKKTGSSSKKNAEEDTVNRRTRSLSRNNGTGSQRKNKGIRRSKSTPKNTSKPLQHNKSVLIKKTHGKNKPTLTKINKKISLKKVASPPQTRTPRTPSKRDANVPGKASSSKDATNKNLPGSSSEHHKEKTGSSSKRNAEEDTVNRRTRSLSRNNGTGSQRKNKEIPRSKSTPKNTSKPLQHNKSVLIKKTHGKNKPTLTKINKKISLKKVASPPQTRTPRSPAKRDTNVPGKASSSKDATNKNLPGSSSEHHKEVDEVIDNKEEEGVMYYLIRWKGCGSESDTWEPATSMDCADLITKYHETPKAVAESSSKMTRMLLPKETKRSISIVLLKTPQASSTPKIPKKRQLVNKEFQVENVLKVREKSGKREFLIRWKNFDSEADSWEPEENLSCPTLIAKLMEKVKTQTRNFPKKKESTNKTSELGSNNENGRRVSLRLKYQNGSSL